MKSFVGVAMPHANHTVPQFQSLQVYLCTFILLKISALSNL